MQKRLQNFLGIMDTNLSLVDRAWQLFTFLVIFSGGTVATISAKASAYFGDLGMLVWLGVGLFTSLILAICFALIRYAGVKGAEKQYVQSMALRGGGINPLQDSFSDTVIHIHELYLPRMQLHRGKHFKRCIFVGPGAIAILGGTYSHSQFHETGQAIPIPNNTYLTGTVVLQDCIVDQCQFVQVTLLAPTNIAVTLNGLMPPIEPHSTPPAHPPSSS